MVDLSEIQAVYYMVAATGVLVAAGFYIVNLRETTRNRKVTLTTNLMQNFTSEEGVKRFGELMNMEWTDFSDFMKKYDSKVNNDNFSKRLSFWMACETLGYQCRSGLIDIDTIYNVSANFILLAWVKFKPIIDEYKKFDYSKDYLNNFEYLARRMSLMQARRDPSFKGSQQYIRPEEYDQAYGKK